MKKLYLFGVLLSAIGLNAQTVIYSQPTTTTNGIVSDVLANNNFVAAADDFKLTSQNKITKIKIEGFQNAGTLETTIATGAVLYIYANNGGMPAGIPNNPAVTPIAKVDVAKGAPGYGLVKTGTSNYTFTIDVTAALPTPVILQANAVYWLVFAAKTNLTAYTGTTRFNWFAGQINDNPALLVDPSNAFGAGATNWTSLSALTATPALDGLAFSIEGESVLGVHEVYNSVKSVSVSPNPTTDYLFVTSKSKVSNVAVFDVSGRKLNVNFDGEKVDVRNLQAGNYMISIENKDGKITEKFIKK
ncbi:T9SS type A sorting domain-containing protein [Chryseobacterium populi]|uniref:Por secretion system C-terminal sorting domain containing protein n=1 Tax=Chryseobacterium populi TaxID=1144316 RepID=J2KBD4_9FLAO|nr:T9SS type A sorting domain-containing protein [Chryseobacterium populi]EJL70493.1 Por secretion system C-terminal sorting domain containing protein [Chryseobacterium populi]